jgi:hypothetical protein
MVLPETPAFSSSHFGLGRNVSRVRRRRATLVTDLPTEKRRNPHGRTSVSSATSHRVPGTVLSEHRTSMGLVRYRRWEGSITVELLLLDEPIATLAVLPAAPRTGGQPSAERRPR